MAALTGIELEPGRMAAIAQHVAGRTTGRELVHTVDYLCESPDFASKLRYGKPLSASDLLTTSFKAVPYATALDRWYRAGCPGTFPDAMFKVVKSNNETLFVELPRNVSPRQLQQIANDETSFD